jgi:hypothetical protein
MLEDGKIKIVAISGSGRSGSTILSILLSQNHDVFNLGQSRDFWHAFGNARCSCEAPMTECRVWSSAVAHGFENWDERDFKHTEALMKKFFRSATRISDWSNSKNLDQLRNDHSEYLEILERLISNCSTHTGACTFVDSSKSPEMALAYSLLDNVSVFVLNLARDPRSVACSWEKKFGTRKVVKKFCRAWKKRQIRLTRWAKGLGKRYRAVRYEEFVESPEETIQNILCWCEANPETAFFSNESVAAISWQNQHLYPPANERVISEKKTDVTIAGPNEWRTKKNFLTHLLALIFSFPTGTQYILQNSSKGR